MKAAPKHVNNDSKRSATEVSQGSWQNQLAQVADHRQQAVVQRALIDSIADSPRMLMQRRQIEGYLGSDPHLTTTPVRPTSQSSQQQTVQCAKKSSDDNPIHAQNNDVSIAHKPNNTGLPDNLKSGIETLSGLSMDNVRVHYNSSKPAQINALAYAQRTDIHLASGQEQHLPHEAWHVVQQAQGRVRPTSQMNTDLSINGDTVLEREADLMGGRAASSNEHSMVQKTRQFANNEDVGITLNDPIIQRKVGFEFETGNVILGANPKQTIYNKEEGFHIDADTANSDGHNIEFVTDPAEGLKETLNTIEKIKSFTSQINEAKEG